MQRVFKLMQRVFKLIHPKHQQSTLPAPQLLTELHRFMGVVNQLGKFSRKIAEIG